MARTWLLRKVRKVHRFLSSALLNTILVLILWRSWSPRRCCGVLSNWVGCPGLEICLCVPMSSLIKDLSGTLMLLSFSTYYLSWCHSLGFLVGIELPCVVWCALGYQQRSRTLPHWCSFPEKCWRPSGIPVNGGEIAQLYVCVKEPSAGNTVVVIVLFQEILFAWMLDSGVGEKVKWNGLPSGSFPASSHRLEMVAKHIHCHWLFYH